MKRTMVAAIGLAMILGVGLFIGPREPVAFAQAPRVVDFVVVSGTCVLPANGTDAGDAFIFTGPAKSVISSLTCGGNTAFLFPVQNAVVVDPAGGRATRVSDAIVVADSDATPPVPPPAVKPGTRLVNLQTLTQCQNTDASIGYDRYRGTVPHNG